jgi:phosphoenolpyruvate synthase/pyruvate phosphate dikinase
VSYLIPFTDGSRNCSPETIGSKAYNLIHLLELGIKVPPGFVISSEFKALDSKKEIEDLIKENLEKLKTPFLMVRSSGVGEDGADFSYAGQLDSFQVKNNMTDIVTSIQKCHESLGNERLETYSDHNHQKVINMGIIVQEMIEPEFAGVLFTQAPNSPYQKMIEYVEGHCEKLVSGEVTPETLYIPNEKNVLPVFVPKLVEISNKILNVYKTHQDIEWAYKNEEVFIVQTRPITTKANWISWSSTNVNENYPDKLSPLLYSIARRSYYHYFNNLGEKLGIPTIASDEGMFFNIIGEWGGKMYYNMSSIHGVIALTPFRSLIGKSFDDFVGYQKEIQTETSFSTRFLRFKFSCKVIYHAWDLKYKVRRIENLIDSYKLNRHNKSICESYHEFLGLRFNDWINASFADFFAMLSHGGLGKFLNSLSIENANGLQNNLVQSIPGLISNEPIFELWEIKKYVLNNNFQFVFDNEDNEKILKRIETEKEFSSLNKMISTYLETWGFRCSGELTFLTDNFSEDPIPFVSMLKSYIGAESHDPKDQFYLKHLEQKKILKELKIEINHKYIFFKAIPLTFVLSFLVKFTMFSISCRERVRLKQACMYYEFKKSCMELAKRLTQKNILTKEKDIFFLEYDEISRILNEEYVDKSYIQELIKLRYDKFEKGTEFPENFYGNNQQFANIYSDQDETYNPKDGVFLGMPACGGVIKARAVVLDSVHEIHKLKKGDILITKQTDPGWICAFPLISGLVVERGGMLSHGAIVAREFGIPAVVGIKGITTQIKTNDIISIDGNKGTVECLTQ